jgi:isopentenyl phosphate kinase
VKGVVFLKLGGSLLTDKTRPQALRADALDRLAGEIAGALSQRPGLRLLIGHGSGSFGHVAASSYRTRDGVASPEAWRGYAETARAAAELNRLVVSALGRAGAPALPIQPSASARCRDGELTGLDFRPIRMALLRGLAPVIYGDVALDSARGGTIVSTEELFAWLAPRLRPERIILAGEVPGVMTADPAVSAAARLIPVITPESLAQLSALLGGSRGADVTGGMAAKVTEMVALLQAVPSLRSIQIISGMETGLVQRVLEDPRIGAGTRIVRG